VANNFMNQVISFVHEYKDTKTKSNVKILNYDEHVGCKGLEKYLKSD
jgi:hypothetical protein